MPSDLSQASVAELIRIADGVPAPGPWWKPGRRVRLWRQLYAIEALGHSGSADALAYLERLAEEDSARLGAEERSGQYTSFRVEKLTSDVFHPYARGPLRDVLTVTTTHVLTPDGVGDFSETHEHPRRAEALEVIAEALATLRKDLAAPG